MDKKTAGVTDIVANFVTEDQELQKAAIQLQEKRSRESEQEITNESIEKGSGPKLVPPPKNPKPDTPNQQPKEVVSRQRSKQTSVEKSWSNPTAALNTRIPPEMDQLLDDHVAKQKRQWKLEGQNGKKPTKQTIVQTALAAFFKSHKS